jgi:hypothetical protein
VLAPESVRPMSTASFNGLLIISVIAVIDAIGYDAYDVGPLSEGWRFEVGAIAYAYSH